MAPGRASRLIEAARHAASRQQQQGWWAASAGMVPGAAAGGLPAARRCAAASQQAPSSTTPAAAVQPTTSLDRSAGPSESSAVPTNTIPTAYHPWGSTSRGFAAAAGAEPQAAAPRNQHGRQRGSQHSHTNHQQQRQQQQQARPNVGLQQPNVGLQQRLGRLTAILGCEPAAAEALAQEYPILLLLGPYALRRLASPSLESVVAGGHPGGAWAGGGSIGNAAAAAGAAAGAKLLFETVVDAPSSLQFRAMHWGMRLHIGQLAAHCHDLGLAVDAGKDFAVVWLGPRLQQRVVRRPPPPPPHLHQKQQQHRGTAAGTTGGSSSSKTAADNVSSGGGVGAAAAAAPFLLVAYRHGAVVLLGPPSAEPGEGEFEMPAADAAALSRAIPLGAFYRTGLPMAPRHAGPSLAQPLAADFHNVRVDPSAEEPAALGLNEAILRVLDVGHLRVVSSILGQSVALAQVDREMDNALTSLHAAMAGAKGGRGVGIFSGPRDSRLFKAAAFGSMAITEAHNLLDAGELSWRYDAFSQGWELMAEEYCLATRFQSLQLKLDEYKQTATFDLKQSHGRRYAKLTDRVILLLLISCLIALIELALPQQANDNGSGGGRRRRRGQGTAGDEGEGGSGGDGGGVPSPAEREWRWDEGGEERRRWWQLRAPASPRRREVHGGGDEALVGDAAAGAAAAVASEVGGVAAAGDALDAAQAAVGREAPLLIEEEGAEGDAGGWRRPWSGWWGRGS